MMKSLFTGFFLLSCIFWTSLSFAERTCTKTVTTSDGTKTINVECSSSFTKDKNPDIIRSPRILNDKTDDLIDGVNQRLQQQRDRTADRTSVQVDVSQRAADVMAKEQAAIEAVRLKQQKP